MGATRAILFVVVVVVGLLVVVVEEVEWGYQWMMTL
jgi:hypothetical protein